MRSADYPYRRMSMLALLLASAAPCAVLANPTGGTVSAGSATIGSSGSTLTVKQTTDKAIIDWRGFDIENGETTTFEQPSAKSITLNRVNSESASVIDGNLNANGNVVIVNQNGVLFGKNSVVNVNSLVATTADIDNENFIKGDYKFDKPGNPNAAIINEGQITAKQAGLVGLVAPKILNTGIITAKLGRIHLASGDTATVDLYGDGLMEVAASPKLQEQIVANTGLLSAEGGKIALTAAAAKETVQSLIQVSGALNANSVGTKNGEIWIYAEGSNAVKDNVTESKGEKTGSSMVLVDGIVSASGRNAGERGGKITITGDNVALLNGTIIDASGYEGKSKTTEGKSYSATREGSAGGDVRIGGDYLGQGTTPTAKNLYVAPYAFVFNDALNIGDAGRNIFWSDGTTQFYGNVYARALGGKTPDVSTGYATEGGNEGNGGFVETSGHENLDVGGYVDLTSSNGKRGTYFLDPTNITIYGNVTPAFNASAGITDGTQVSLSSNLKLWLDASDTSSVTLSYNTMGTTATGASGANTITVGSTAGLQVGMRVQLDTNTSQLASVNDTSNIYTITAINGTTITLDTTLSQTYTGVTLYGGYVSQLADKSGSGNNAIQSVVAAMPLWRSNGLNDRGATLFDGSNDYLSIPYAASLSSGYLSVWVIADNLGLGGYQSPLSNRTTSGISGYNFHAKDVSTWQAWIGQTSSWGVMDGAAIVENAATLLNLQLHNTASASFYQDGEFKNSETSYSEQTNGPLLIGAGNNGLSITYFFNGFVPEAVIYGTDLSTNAQALVSQYQSAKWGPALTGPGVIGSEVGLTGTEAQTAMASVQAGATTDGYSVFAASYLNRLSQSSDIILQASNNINLDLQGATLSLAAGKNITLTAGNQILTASTGGITTSQSSGSGGNITFNATNGIVFNNAFALNSGGGNINLNNAVTLNADLTANAGSGTLTFGSAVNGAHNLISTAGTFSLGGVIGGTNALNSVSLTSVNSLTLPSISAASIFAQTTGDTSDITLASSKSLTASGPGNALTLKAGESIILNSSDTLTTSGGNVILWSNANNKSAGNIQMTSAQITSNGGSVTLAGGLDDGANGGTAGDGIPDNYARGTAANLEGIKISAGGINSGFGSISIRGYGADSSTISNSYGALVDGLLQSTNGVIEVYGVGGNAVDRAHGVRVEDTITSQYGNITIVGTGGSPTGGINTSVGLIVTNGGHISSTGSGEASSIISLYGTSAATSGAAWGVYLKGDNAISSVDGAINVSGTATSGTSSTRVGASLGGDAYGNSSINTTGAAPITLTGIGSSSDLTLAPFSGYSYSIGGPSAQGNIALYGDTLSLGTGTFSIQTAGSITIKPRTASTSIGINGGAGTLRVTTALLDSLHPGTSLIIGDSAAGTGAVTINGWDLRGKTYDVGVYGGPITFASSGVLWNNPQDLLFSATGTDVSDINIGQAFTYSGTGTSNLTFKAGESIITSSASITASSTGTLNIVEWANANNKSAGNIQITTSTINSNGGNITLAGGLDDGANGGTAGDGIPDNYAWGYGTTANNNVQGVFISGGNISTASGFLTIRGHGDASYSSGLIHGINIKNAAVLNSSSGPISMTGMGGNGTYDNMGLWIDGTSTKISTQTGPITITGTGGGTTNTNWGIFLGAGAEVLSTGTTGAAAITLIGTGGGGTSANSGVGLQSGGFITSSSGSIFVTGTGGSGSGYGVSLNFTSDSIMSTGDAAITITGAGVNASDVNFSGINVGSTVLIGGPSDTGPIAIIANSILAPNAGMLNIQTSGSITIKPRTAGTTVGVGPTSGSTLNISSALLSGTYSTMTAGSYIFGSATAGLVTVNTVHDFGNSNVSFLSGTSINLAGTLTKSTGSNAANYVFQADDDIYNSNSAGISATSGSVNLTLQSNHDDDGGAIYLSGGTISTNGGNVTIGGGSGSISAGSGYAYGDGAYTNGVQISSSINSGEGNIIINGRGYENAGANNSTGIYLTTGGLRSSSGDITLNGFGAQGLTGAYFRMGVIANAPITSATGDILINGTGGLGGNAFGVWVWGTTSSTGTGASAGTITINGWAPDVGVAINGGAVQSVDGAITITGTGTAAGARGISFYNSGGSIRSTGSAPITLNGSGYGSSADIVLSAYLATNTTYTIGGALDTGSITLNANGSGIIRLGNGSTCGTGAEPCMGTLILQTSDRITINGNVNYTSADSEFALSAIAGSLSLNGTWGGLNPLESVSLSSVQSISLPSISIGTTGSLLVQTTGANANVTIPVSTTLSAFSAGTAITLAASGNFINESATPFSVSGGARWLVYSSSVTDTALNGLTPGFVRYTCTYGGSCPSIPGMGNGFLYSATPILTATPTAVGSVTYGSSAPSLVGYGYSLSGYLGPDASADTITGSLTGSTTYAQGSDVGSYNISYLSGGLASALGYGFSYTTDASAIPVVPKTLIASLAGGVSKVYDGTTSSTLDPDTNYSLSGIYGTDSVRIGNTSGVYGSNNVGTSLMVTVSGLTLVGPDASNYTLASSSVSGVIGSISKAMLRVIANDKTIYAGVPNVEDTGSTNLVAHDVPLVSWIYTPQGYAGLPGTYEITASANDPQNRLANYTITYVSGTLTANALPSTVITNMQLPLSNANATLGMNISDNSEFVANSSDGSESESDAYAPSVHERASSNSMNDMKSGRFIEIEISPALQKLLGFLPKIF